MLTALMHLLPFPIFYLMGVLPTGFLLARAQGLDIRSAGSGNVGATNVARVLGKKMGLLTLLLDASKGFLATLLAGFISHDNLTYMAAAGFCCVAGHCFSIPGKLTGGKGVATALGTILALNVWFGVVALATFILVMLVVGIVSVASLGATAMVVIFANMLNIPDGAWFALALISLLIFYKHKDNLKRLALGEEKRFRFSKT